MTRSSSHTTNSHKFFWIPFNSVQFRSIPFNSIQFPLNPYEITSIGGINVITSIKFHYLDSFPFNSIKNSINSHKIPMDHETSHELHGPPRSCVASARRRRPYARPNAWRRRKAGESPRPRTRDAKSCRRVQFFHPFLGGIFPNKNQPAIGGSFFFIKITSQTWRFPFVGLALVMIINHYEHHQNHNSSSVFSYKIHFSGISIVNQPFHPLIDELYIRYKQFCGIFHYKR